MTIQLNNAVARALADALRTIGKLDLDLQPGAIDRVVDGLYAHRDALVAKIDWDENDEPDDNESN